MSRVCTKCGADKQIDQFYRAADQTSGYRPECKSCQNVAIHEYRRSARGVAVHLKANNKYKATSGGKVSQKKYRANVPPERLREIERKHRYKKIYGISTPQYDIMLVAQHGRCRICGDPVTLKKRLCVDHSHTTGGVRGLLCGPCNLALGRYEKYQQEFSSYLGV